MILKVEVVEERLKLLDEVASELERHAGASGEELASDMSKRWILERGLIAGANLIFDVADHILAGHFQARPETYARALRELRDRGVLTSTFFDEIQGLGGLRNVLVHLYARIDPAKIAEHARSAPDRFRTFRTRILNWLATTGNRQA